MARNDIERALRDVLRVGENDDPDFSYVGEPVGEPVAKPKTRGAASTLTANVKHRCSS